ncbi:shikimate dehydrogenase [Anaerosphaera aminiphila DSM 21120]|uniref:Shikimate dehydrogenase (NADP(+)) n=1 Tax=Anaerosphaera aminiphila DSM 21120 TaxID=1120995 RepID=A0A1M5NR46_9FIRM|nr:shikimate dehydrogenase [Anaerosphaera aminiphila]SHG91915.1 shikimate dehydrogenase [Anaerosphaera aminiphila DSM 21120]
MANRIQGTTGLIGLLGNPLKHSRSPHMHNSAFEKLNLDYVYLCFELEKEDLKQGIEALKLFGALGSNITFPNKQEVIKYLDYVSEDARIIGSVNTVKIDPITKETTGYNTDGAGFIASIEEQGIEYKGKKAVLIGVGGAGRAIAIQLAYEGLKDLVIKEIDKDLASEIKSTIEKNIKGCNVKIIETEKELSEELKDSVLLINATPLGMKGRDDRCSISSPKVISNSDVFVYDIVYDPRETLFMKYAKEAGCETCNGINMMIWQGALAFKIWLGVDMPQDYVRQELFEES